MGLDQQLIEDEYSVRSSEYTVREISDSWGIRRDCNAVYSVLRSAVQRPRTCPFLVVAQDAKGTEVSKVSRGASTLIDLGFLLVLDARFTLCCPLEDRPQSL